ncbi:uncharacterized protein NECHADRAFT_47676 [Fusarium vanettenii 77-13-4]|uniref:Cytochrome P450 n=1 Tax=Fusarium vanettenii (strain ATCC MYA-4622 / CBS 123669 / FGSC 9596 / NRRL 45880 / 77-13-4) TaxID=660122 RepID=C7Z0A3_FUSV7|nr:uncharacterized protein NECHADRAFT_47676 [Fusarium vanettenii 77-13-4]EEU42755.1 hypothetical protein NECHADRAFT_47676 [Fusarium vanettenii 77-13-4]
MFLLSIPALSIAIAVCALFYVWKCVSSPLWAAPGPFLSRFTPFMLRWNEFNANRTLYIHSLHLKYGPIVRIAPNEMSFSSYEAVKEIYGSKGSGYDKSTFYDLFTVFGRRTLFSTLDKTAHAKRKRLLADRYANSNVLKPASLNGIENRAREFARQCGDSTGSSRLFMLYTPTLYKYSSKILDCFFEPRATPLADNFVTKRSKLDDPEEFTLLSRLRSKLGDELAEGDIASECLDHMVAGIDTTGDVLCFLIWELSQPRSAQFQDELRRELKGNPDMAFDKLPVLDSIVQEGLRCFPAIPMSLPRVVPKDGRVIDDIFVPEDTIVSSQAYSVQRHHAHVFPEPDRFNPHRWMSNENDAEMRRHIFAFSYGGRGCIGKHLAYAEMKLLLREVYSQYQTVPDPSMTEESMRAHDQIISARPFGQKCLLRFVPTAA